MSSLEVHQISVVDNASTSSPAIESRREERWIKKVQEKLKPAFLSSPQQFGLLDGDRKPKMRKSMLSEELISRPTMVTVGPFHMHEITGIADEAKWLIVNLMTRLYHLDLAGCLAKIKNQVADALTCYSDSDISQSFGSKDDNRFAEMLLLDSCFILFMLTSSDIRSTVTRDGVMLFILDPSKRQEITLGRHVMARVVDILSHKDKVMLDLLILDNQIPFFVIEELYKELKMEKPLHKYALEFFETIHPRSTRGRKGQMSPPKFLHLLHLFHWSRVPENKCNVLSSWRSQLDDVYWECYTPTAMELRKSATVFESKTSGSSLDITFRRVRIVPIVMVLNIPRIHIHDYSSHIFHNLIAFEMQFPSSDPRTVAFSAIMRNLLQSEEDVKLFRRRGVLASTSMTDSKLVDFFRSLSRLTNNYPMPIDVYVFCCRVMSYHNQRMSRFCGGIILKCFPNW